MLRLVGFDTSASTQVMTLYYLQKHPRCMEALVAEQQKLAAQYGEVVTARVLRESVYAEAVVRCVRVVGW